MDAHSSHIASHSLAIIISIIVVSFSALVFFVSPVVAVNIYKKGVLASDETWGPSDTYIVVGNVTVPSGVTLVIQPGTTVKFDPSTALYVDGTLIADGTSSSPISFLANMTVVPRSWIGVQFNGSSIGSVSWGIFERAERAVTVVDSSPPIHNNTVTSGSMGFVFLGSASTVANNTITNISSSFPVGVYASGVQSFEMRNNVIQRVRGARGANGLMQGESGGKGASAYGVLIESSISVTMVGNTIDSVSGGRGGDGMDNSSGIGGRGGDGGSAVGIAVSKTSLVDIGYNSITDIVGGRGGLGGGSGGTAVGGDGGNAGAAIAVQTSKAGVGTWLYGNYVDGITGGEGGNGGEGSLMDGNGGIGGDALGVALGNALNAYVALNQVQNLLGGSGGNSSSTGLGTGIGGDGGNALGISAFGASGTNTVSSNLLSSLTGGLGGRGITSGGVGGDSTGIFAYGYDSKTFNLTTSSSNWIQMLTGGDGGDGFSAGGEGGSAVGISTMFVNTSSTQNVVWMLKGGTGGDALSGSNGGRGGGAVGVAAIVVPNGTSSGDRVDTVTQGAMGAGPPAQASYGIGFYTEGNVSTTTRLTIDNATIASTGTTDLFVNNYTEAVTVNTTFNEAKLVVEVAGNLTVRNFLGMDVFWPNGMTPVAGSGMLVLDDGVPVWDFVSSTGQERWLLVTDRVYINSDVATEHETVVTVSYLGYSFANNNTRKVDMATTHVETFLMVDSDDPSSAVSPLPPYTNAANFTVFYTATDGNGTGLATVTLWYNKDDTGWTPFATQSAAGSGQFNFTSSGDGLYQFATIVEDVAGNTEPGPFANDTWTSVDTVRPGSHVNPLGTYQTSASFVVGWAPDSGVTDIVAYTIQYKHTTSGWSDWLVNTTLTSEIFTASPTWGVYEFRSIAVDAAGNVEFFTANDTWTIVDIDSPNSSVTLLPPYQTSLTFAVSWGPQFDTTDISSYTIEFKDNGGPWIIWLSGTVTTSANFAGSDGHTYEFRSIATDLAGNLEGLPLTNDTWTRVDVTPPDSRVSALQPYSTSLTFSISWGPAPGTADIAAYSIEVSDSGGAWTSLADYVDTTQTSALFVGADGHTYAFRSIAKDWAGNVENAPSVNDTWTIVDITRPYVLSGAPRGSNTNTTPTITLTFSEPMDRLSAEQAFTITPDMNGVLSWSEDSRVLTFIPERPLESGTTYVVAIDSSASDVAGNRLGNLYTFQFTTIAASAPTGFGFMDMWWMLAVVAIVVGSGLSFLVMRRRSPHSTPQRVTGAKSSNAAIDDVFLLYHDGLLIKHETRRLKPDIDTDILSGMLTAVQQFVKDSFRSEEGELDEMTFGQMHILIGRGKWLILAGIVTGENTLSMSEQIKRCIQDMEDHHEAQIESWDGDVAFAKILSPYIKKLINEEYA